MLGIYSCWLSPLAGMGIRALVRIQCNDVNSSHLHSTFYPKRLTGFNTLVGLRMHRPCREKGNGVWLYFMVGETEALTHLPLHHT